MTIFCKNFNPILIHFSTDFVFDGTSIFTEEDAVNPISVYGEKKLNDEIQIEKRLSKYFIIRTA